MESCEAVLRLGIFCSGGLGLSCLQHLRADRSLQFVATDSRSESIIEYAQENRIPVFRGNPREGRLRSFLAQNRIDLPELCLSLNYLFLLDSSFLECGVPVVNFHGSLLPKYRGRTPHVWAIINNEKETGVTAHFVDAGCDTGDVLLQEVVPIGSQDTGASILSRYNALYPEMIDSILKDWQAGTLVGRPQDESKATYFGKRTPDDGQIHWDWCRERIENWVRAQSDPYPGAFCFRGEEKIIVDRVRFSDLGFRQEQPNGLVLSAEGPPVVKTPNGALELTTLRGGVLLSQGDILV